MFTVNINGKDYESEQDKKLLRFLRDDLHLTAAKDGCSEGVCGTCTVLVDGKKTKACTVSLSRLAGRKVLTVEGIRPEEMNPGHDYLREEPSRPDADAFEAGG